MHSTTRRIALSTISTIGALALIAPAAAARPSPHRLDLRSQDLAVAGVGSPIYRIPALAKTTKGTLLAAYDARPSMSDLPSHIRIMLRRSTDGGHTWSTQQVVRSAPAPKGFGDPSLLVDHQTGRIFLFYAAGVNAGFASSGTGNDPTDPNILQTDYSYSDDDGLTWHHRRITQDIKDPAWGGLFAASGEGIQLTTGPYAGRLLQQYVIRYDGQNYAASAYSDDHGTTWHMGKLVGPGMDENKVVQLADGTVMLNSRATPYRKVAYSTDGGVTYHGLHQDTELPDPADNGSIIRYDDKANRHSPQSHWLLFSNNDTTSGRRNLTVKQSCDDGRTWPIKKVVDSGPSAYSTLTRVSGNEFGLLWEKGGYQSITYSSFTKQWLNGVCAPVTVKTPGHVAGGSTTDVSVTVRSEERGAISHGRVNLALPDGWSAPSVRVPHLRHGESATAKVPVTVPKDVSTNAFPITATFSSNKGQSQGTTDVVAFGGTKVLDDSTSRTFDGSQITDLSDRIGEVKDLSGGSVSVTFSTNQSAPAAVLLSEADPISQVRDLVLSINHGTPYAEVRTAAGSYPVRLTSTARVDDGKEHTLTFASNDGTSSLILDGTVIASAQGQGFFDTITSLTKPYPGLNPSGLPNLTLGANRAYVASQSTTGETDRWFFKGTIDSVQVYSDAS